MKQVKAAVVKFTKDRDWDQFHSPANLTTKLLRHRIAKLTAKKIIPVADWAKDNNINLQSATNKAIRGTIPAFRIREHWMIDRDYTE